MHAAPDIAGRIQRVADDRESGASQILDEVIAILADVLSRGQPVLPVARALCRAQPSMAPVWNAALEAVAAESAPERFERFAARVHRSAAALARVACDYLTGDRPDAPLRLVTLSFSGSVVRTIEALSARRELHVSCSDSRPALEGRRLATHLAAAGIPVTCFGDAALGHALATADAVLLGADAVAPDWFFNKCGSRMLAAAALQQGVPLYVLATRDKFVTAAVAASLTVRDADPQEIWPSPPPGVTVRNPYFEATPLDLVSTVITDSGAIGATLVADVCAAQDDAALGALLTAP